MAWTGTCRPGAPGPALLLIHGTGASSHTWAALADALADRFTLIMPDLPGQGFSGALPESDISLDGFSRHLKGLLDSLGVRPKLMVGHSAGAVIATQMTLHCQFAPAAIVSLNGAFLPLALPRRPCSTGWPSGCQSPPCSLISPPPTECSIDRCAICWWKRGLFPVQK